VVRTCRRGRPPAVIDTADGLERAMTAAYDATGGSWERGPGRVYNHLADVVVDLSPVTVAGRLVVDVGAGTGAGTRAIERRGGRVIAVDVAFGVLASDRAHRPPAVMANARALPLAGRSVDGVVAAFSLNHIRQPVDAFAEAWRICRPGSPIVVAAYADDDDHPVKAAVQAVLCRHGWEPPSWYAALQREVVPQLSTEHGARAAARRCGRRAEVHQRFVPMPWLSPGDLVDWRLGMAQHAPYVDRLPSAERALLRAAALDELGPDAPPLERRIVVLTAIV
jgi:SAM-dependent methyltransferase